MTTIALDEAMPVAVERERLIYLDGWRGWAVTLVLIGHFLPIPGINLGTAGVELFFVLSGRLMAEILFVKKTPLAQFFPRRINRVYPALFVFVVSMLVVTWTTEFKVGPKATALALVFLSNYSTWIPGFYQTGFFDHLWSLCVEEHAYVLLALIVLVARWRNWSPLILISIVAGAAFIDGAASVWVFHQDYFHAYWRTDVHIGSIFVAAAIFLYLTRFRSLPSWVPVIALVAGLLLRFDDVPRPISYSLGTALIALSVCTLDRAPAWFLAALTNRISIYVGLISYSLYLWQQPFYKMNEQAGLPWWAGLAAAFACGAASYYLIEKPSRGFLNRLTASLGKKSSGEPVVAPTQ
ncbi:acyltransferase [soil metagenome]